MDGIEAVLLSLGIGKRYKGHAYLCYGLRLALEDETRLYNAKRELFTPIAQAFGTNAQAVERNLRTAISRGWLANCVQMEAMAGYPMTQPPSIKEFMDILVTHLLRHSASVDMADDVAISASSSGKPAQRNSEACSAENLRRGPC